MSGASYTVDVIAGDGIGPEVMAAAVACVDAIAPALDFTVRWREREWGSDYFRKHGRMMPTDGIDQLATGDATLLGAVGAPDIPDDVTLWGLLIPIRREFQQYVNLRPVRILPGVVSPLAGVDEPRHRRRPRERRGGVLRDRRQALPRPAGGDGRPGGGLHPRRDRAGRPVRDRARAATQRATRVRDQVQRHHPHDAVLGRGRRGVRRRQFRGEPGERPDRRAGGPDGAATRHDSTSSSAPTCSATSSRTCRLRSPARSGWPRAPT